LRRPQGRSEAAEESAACPWCRVEVPVDGGAGNAEEVGDLLNGALTRVVELLGERDLLGVEPRSAAALTSAGAGSGESVAGIGDDELAL
jgi:hypothetical protein